MAKAGRGQTRRESKRRVLRPGESVRADGKYQYKYHIDGKPHFVYSWKLEPTDKLPKGKKPCLSLRELEKQVNTDLDLLVKADSMGAVINSYKEIENSQRAQNKPPRMNVLQINEILKINKNNGEECLSDKPSSECLTA